MRRHADYDDLVLLADSLKFKRVVALMTIKDQQLIGANALISMLDKVPQPLNTKLISCPSILT